jgi:hypothetical protein
MQQRAAAPATAPHEAAVASGQHRAPHHTRNVTDARDCTQLTASPVPKPWSSTTEPPPPLPEPSPRTRT